MNKKAFIGATVITVTVVGGLVYYRHQLRTKLAEAGELFLEDPSEEEPGGRPLPEDLLDRIVKNYRDPDNVRRSRSRYPNPAPVPAPEAVPEPVQED